MGFLMVPLSFLKAIGGKVLAGAQASASAAGGAASSIAGALGAAGATVATTLGVIVASGTVATAITVGAVSVAVVTGGFGAYYAVTKQPLPFIPGVPEVPLIGQAVKAQPPRYVFSIHGVAEPVGVAVGPVGGRIYVTEAAGQRSVRVFDPDGRPLGALAPSDTAPLSRFPLYVTVDPKGKVYVTDRLRQAVDLYGPNGSYLGRFEPQGAKGMLPNPLGITTDNQATLYVTEVSGGNHRVMAFDEAGRLRMAFGKEGKGTGEFSYPNALAVDGQGRFYVSDSNNNRIVVLDKEGVPQGVVNQAAGDSLGLPKGLALDTLGRLHVVDTVGSRVVVYDTKESPIKFLYSFGEPGRGDGRLSYPTSIAVDSATGRVYVADRENNRVSVWAY